MLLDKENYQGTLKKASFDDANQVSLIDNDGVTTYLLDEMAKDMEKIYAMDRPSTCDSLYIGAEENFVIEFKNRKYGRISSNDKREIRKKAYQTPELLLNTVFRDSTMENLAKRTTLLVVFKSMEDREESFGKFADKLNDLANGNTPRIRCKLGQFKGAFYKDVQTIGKEEFEEKYLPLWDLSRSL